MGFIRTILIMIDAVIYSVVGTVLQAIMDLANIELFQQSVIREFANRIYIILGLVMLFKMIISFIQILIDPDKMDDKESGMANVLKRVVVALLLIVMVPSIFDLARQVQNQILPIIPKVVLGVEADLNSSSGQTTLSSAGREMAFYTFLAFFNYDNASCDDGSIRGTGSQLSTEGGSSISPSINTVNDAVSKVNVKCNASTDNSGYRYQYRMVLSTIVGLYLIATLVQIAIRVAIRAFKFAICEFIAPIPIASYVDPKTSKQAFDNWVKTSTETYVSLFINLVVIYFMIFVFEKVLHNDFILGLFGNLGGDWWRTSIVIVFIIIGLTKFAKDAPKFITDMLGIKGDGEIASIFKGAGSFATTAAALPFAGAMAAMKARTKSGEASESEELQGSRARMAMFGATGRFLYDRMRGKKLKESLSGSQERTLSKVENAIERTAGYTPPGESATIRHARAATRGYYGARIGSAMGASPPVAKHDSAIKTMQDYRKNIDSVRSAAKGHKVYKKLNEIESNLRNASIKDIRGMLSEEAMNLERLNSEGALNAIQARRLSELRAKFTNTDGEYDWSSDTKISQEQATMVHNANRETNDFTKLFTRVAAGDTAARDKFVQDYAEFARGYGDSFLNDDGSVDINKFIDDGETRQNMTYALETIENNLKVAINSNGLTREFFTNGEGQRYVTLDESGRVVNIQVANKDLYDKADTEANRISHTDEYFHDKANSIGIKNNSGNN